MKQLRCIWIRYTWIILLGTQALAQTPPGPRIAALALEGIQAFEEKQVRPFFSSDPGLFRRPRYDPRRVERDVEQLLNFYRNEGFLEARLVRSEIRPAPDTTKVVLTVEINEGQRTLVRSVHLEGAAQIPADSLKKHLTLRPGEPFRQLELLQDRRALQIVYAETGRINAIITSQALQDTGHLADIVFDIREGEPVRVGRIRLEGLDKTRPHIARRQMALGPGQLCRYSLIRRSQTQLYSTGLFKLVQVEPDPGDTLRPGVRDLVVTVRERTAGSLNAGVGYGTSERGRIGFSVVQSNWQGRGLQIGLEGRLSRHIQQLEGGFTEPRIWGRHLSLDGRLFWDRQRNSQARFTARRLGGDMTLSRKFEQSWNTKLRYRLERTALIESALAGATLEARTTSSLMLAAERDTRTDLLNPETGSFVQGRIEWAGGILQGRNHFVRPTATATSYRRLGPLMWAGQIQGRYIHVLGQDSRTVEYARFYLGGDGSIRGFRRDQIGAEIEGNVSLAVQSEVRFPLYKINGVLFLDAGNVWPKVRVVDLTELRYGYGLGLRYASRVGILRLDVGTHRGPKTLWQRIELYVGVGQAL